MRKPTTRKIKKESTGPNNLIFKGKLREGRGGLPSKEGLDSSTLGLGEKKLNSQLVRITEGGTTPERDSLGEISKKFHKITNGGKPFNL